jgi:hypothetical protein
MWKSLCGVINIEVMRSNCLQIKGLSPALPPFLHTISTIAPDGPRETASSSGLELGETA